MNTIARRLGFRFFDVDRSGRWELRLSWAEITGRLGLALGIIRGEDHYSLHVHLIWPNIFFVIPFLRPGMSGRSSEYAKWGASVVGRTVHLNWGHDRCKILHFPWDYQWVRTSYLLADGTWLSELLSTKRGDFPNFPLARTEKRPFGTLYDDRFKSLRWVEVYPYRYVLRSGEVQERQATVMVSEREWRWRWFTWLSFPRGISRTIDIEFSEEVGERSGSWKGGCLGCSYSLWYDEMPVEALRRMEAERKF